MNAKGSRERKPTEKRIDKNLEKLKMQGYLDYRLERVDITGKNVTKIRSFSLSYWRKTPEIGKISVKGTKYGGKKLIPTTEEQKSILELFDCGYLVESSYLRSIGIGSV